MLVSIKELSKYVDLSGLSPEEVAHGLTFAGIEVEEVSRLATGTNLTIGHILECEKHPDSDHLHVLKVDLGKYGTEQIVCGAPNARKGLKVIVARVGAKLKDGNISASTIRGVASNGMCCSLLELGVDSKYLTEAQTKGIEELASDAPIGEDDVLGYLGLDDAVLNLKILANRPDLLSLYNVAREVGAIFSRKVNIPTYKFKADFETDLKVGSQTNKCSQFSGLEVKSIKVGPSPKYMVEALRSMGVRSINNIVDIGNYVMLLTGQPLHMYDADKLPNKELIVKDNLGVDFLALDEKTYKVILGDVVITSNDKAMCLGGIMGSNVCAVDEKSTHIIVESASFDGASIRHTSSRLGLASESSQRFVKGTNHFQANEVLAFVAYLLKECCEGKEFSNIVSYQNEAKPNDKVITSTSYINGRLGTEFKDDEIVNTLARLGFKVTKGDKGKLTCLIPSWRLDVSCAADISEEVIRLLGFDNVKSVLPISNIRVGALKQDQYRLKAIRDHLLALGLDECLTYSLVSKKNAKKYNILKDEEKYELLNPLTDERQVLRTHIAYSLLESASYNVAHQNKSLALFETANMISKSSRSDHLCVALVGNRLQRGMMSSKAYDFYDMKGIVESVFTILGIENSRYKFEVCKDVKELHPGKSAYVIFQNQKIGAFGELHPLSYKDFEFGKLPVYLLELDLALLESAKVSISKMEAISRFPTVSRDLAFLIDKKVAASDIVKLIKVSAKGMVKDAQIFDVYEGENIDPEKKSIAISLTIGSDHTLTEKEINDVVDAVKFELNKKYSVTLRM
ncbi:MAG: phenylalanine--tRNA ligase subunit beta [Bacilli bacterium]|nr:phenylalanine--tRNA ligase subunit beta [Bacilli bacterium]